MSDTIMIPIPAPPEGWIFDAIRTAKRGEQCYRDGKWFLNLTEETEFTYPVAIPIQPKWTPPPAWGEMFGDCWLAVDANGNRYLYKNRPSEGDYELNRWIPNSGGSLHVNHMFRAEMLPPSGIPWYEACWRIEAPK